MLLLLLLWLLTLALVIETVSLIGSWFAVGWLLVCCWLVVGSLVCCWLVVALLVCCWLVVALLVGWCFAGLLLVAVAVGVDWLFCSY